MAPFDLVALLGVTGSYLVYLVIGFAFGFILESAGFGDARRLAVDQGLTGMKPLPPGIRKNLARGKPMPPGIAKTRMPNSYINQLPSHPGYEWQQAGSDLVLVVAGSLVISDVLEGVFD